MVSVAKVYIPAHKLINGQRRTFAASPTSMEGIDRADWWYKVSDDPLNGQSREMIGTGVRRDGLYYFKGTDSVQHLTVNGVTTSFDLWHQRMGHPSEKVMKLLPSVGTAARSFNKAYMTTIPHEEFVHEDFSVIIEEAEPSSTNEPSPQPEPSFHTRANFSPESNLTPEFTSQTERHTSKCCSK
nr:Retrovirus-related Pol polyprotein from transposon TNT 1-94 [Ipomoea batatas]